MPEILPGIHQIPVNYNGRRLNLYLLLGANASILLDTGDASVPDHAILPYMKSIGCDPASLRYVIATHPDTDHTGGLLRMRQVAPQALFCSGTADRDQVSTPAKLADDRYRAFYHSDGLGPDDAARAKLLLRLGGPVTIDLTFTGGERIQLGPVPGSPPHSSDDRTIQILHLPGHSAGHLGIYLPYAGTALIFDACQWRANCFLDGRSAFAPMYLNADAYLNSLKQLSVLNLDRLYSCHWPDCTTPTQVQAFIATALQYAQQAERSIADTLQRASKPLTLREICLAAKPSLGDWPPERDLDTRFLAVAHLQRLIDHHQARQVPTNPGEPRQFASS